MNSQFFLFARRYGNEQADKWLAEHPIVLGGIALAFGLFLLLVGVIRMACWVAAEKKEKKKNKTRRRRRKQKVNHLHMSELVRAIVLLVFGGICSVYGLFKIAFAYLSP